MLPYRSRPRHPRDDVVDIGSVGSSIELDRVSSSPRTRAYAASGAGAGAVGRVYQYQYQYQSSSRSGLRNVTERAAQLSLVSLPIPRLSSNNPAKRSFSVEDSPSTTSSLGLGTTAARMDATGLGSPSSGSRKTTRLFAALRRSNSFSHKRSGKNSSGQGMFSTPAERSASVSPAGSRTASPAARTTQPPSIAQIAMGLHTSRTPHLGPAHGFLLASEPGAQRNGSAVHLHSHSHSHSHSHQHVRGRTSMSPPPSRPQTASSSTRVATPLPLRSSLKKDSQKSGKLDTGKGLVGLGLGMGAGAGASADASRSTSPSASASSVPSTPRSTLSRISLAITRGTGGGRSRLDKFLGRGLGRGIKSPVSSVASLNSNGSDGELGAPRKAVRFVAAVENPDTMTTTKTMTATTTTITGGDNRLHPPRA